MSTRTKASLTDSLKEEKDDTVAVENVEDQGQEEEAMEEARPSTLTTEQEKKMWRKVDMRILPILTVMYLCAFMDKGNAKLQGLASQLDLTGHKYNIVLVRSWTLSVPNPSQWLPAVIVSISTLTGLVKSYPQLMGARIVLGIAEAGLFPGAMYYMTLWYPRYMLQYRIAIFESGSTLAGAFSGLFAYGISFMSGTAGLLGWSWIFILEGILSLVVGLIACFILVDIPDTAKFLTKEERTFIVWKKSLSARITTNVKSDKNSLEYDNSLVGEEERFEMRHLVAGVLDWQARMRLLCVVGELLNPLYGISLFLPFGYNTAISQLLTVPPYVCGVITVIVFAISSDELKIRSPFIFAALLMCLAGFSINISDATIGVKYFGTFLCISGSYAALPGDFAWIGNNLAGQGKRAIGMGLLGSLGNFGAVLASNVYLAQDAPYYKFGHKIELIMVGIGLVSVPLIALAYRQVNKWRDDKQRELEKRGVQYTVEELRRMGDRAPDFRYTL
ncbi:MFS general substrate transporter [Daedalea quercina L-15889]|uniref:MFS general substrate transporter n=1 Tax=Daedalea quercina L-15889 TaxID=1314783 RepID=A0A165KME1_9APHY|nr:MFS general substrate transporter [Daedalea quercina L-15889]